MDKQKQIEEMAEVIRVNCGECYTCKYLDELHCADLLSAEELYNAGYRKIPENAVVLTREEYNELCCSIGVSREEVDRVVDLACKETAEKFARLVEFHSVSTRDNDGREIFTISALGLKEILHEEFGIPYDEICKKITEGE